MDGGGGGGGGGGISSTIGGGSLMIVGVEIVSSDTDGVIGGGSDGILITGDGGGDGSSGGGGGGMNGGSTQILARFGRSMMWLTNLMSYRSRSLAGVQRHGPHGPQTTHGSIHWGGLTLTFTSPSGSGSHSVLHVTSSWHGRLQSLKEELHDIRSTLAGQASSTSTSVVFNEGLKSTEDSLSDIKQWPAFLLWRDNLSLVVLHITAIKHPPQYLARLKLKKVK